MGLAVFGFEVDERAGQSQLFAWEFVMNVEGNEGLNSLKNREESLALSE